MAEAIDSSSDSHSSAGSPSAMALDVSAVSYESGRKALQLAVDGGGSIEEIASLLEEEAEEHLNSSSLDPTDGLPSYEEPVSCDHHTALEVAASAGHMKAVERLLEAGADPDAPVHEKGISVLEAAAGQGRLLVVQKLLETGAYPDHHGRLSGATPLIAAATGGHIEVCKALLQSGANFGISLGCWDEIDLSLGTSSPIEAAAGTSSIALLELFMEAVEDAAKNFDPDNLESAMAEGRQRDSQRLLRIKGILQNARSTINRALVKAAATGDMPILQRLLDAGADVTARSGYYRTGGLNAIASAALQGHQEAMNTLLQAVSDQNNPPADAVTLALQSAVDGGNMALFEPLLQAGADATEIDIRRAVVAGRLDIVTFILQSGASVKFDVFRRDDDVEEFTALQLAARHGHQAIVDLLLVNGAEIDDFLHETGHQLEGATAVQLAVTGGHLAVVEQLIDAGADVNAPIPYVGVNADSPLQAAVRAGDTTMLELLLEAGAVVDFPRGDELGRKKTALSIAAEVNNPDLVARLLSVMPPDVALEHAPVALQWATENQNVDIVRQLLQLHPDLNSATSLGPYEECVTLLQTAAANGNLEILEMLLAEGADVNLNPSEGREKTALQWASEQGDLAAVKLLLTAGAEVDATGMTAPPLLLAIRGGHVEVFDHLLAAGADIHATAYRGQTMLEAADESGDADIQDRLQAVLASRPPPQIDQPPNRGTGPLCETCRTAPLAELFWEDHGPVELHPSLTALRASAAEGCPFCCFVWKRLGITSISMPQPSPVTFLSQYLSDTMECIVEEPFPEKRFGDQGLRISTEFHYLAFPSDRRVPITEDTSSPETYKQIRTWLDTCKNEHPNCRPPSGDPSLPTRLIYLDPSRDSSLSNPTDTKLQPRLISTNDVECSECRYIALSYRWPEDFPVEAKSTQDNIREQMRGLKTSRLPLIFNDLFQVAVRLGISYVWIDSLCIVQDDPEDWNREAARMIQIYRYAELTVAAAAPPTESDLGLFRHGDPSDVTSVRLPSLRDPPKYGADYEVVLLKPQKELYGESPLVSRGWCFQEREISQRIVHYTETQVLWECRALRASEGFPDGLPTENPLDEKEVIPVNKDWSDRMLDNDLNDEMVENFWYRAVGDYSARQLTVYTDKFPALAGLAAAFREYKPADCRYLAGLWEDNFLGSLLWSSRTGRDEGVKDYQSYERKPRTITNTRYPEYVAPTWSWASVAGPISYDCTFNPKTPSPVKFALKILDIDVQTSTNDPFSAVKHAVLTCTAGLLPGVLQMNDSPSSDRPDYAVINDNGIGIGEMDFDVPQEKFDEDVTIVFCVHLGGEYESSDYGPALVVLPTGNKENEYRRVGMIKDVHLSWFRDPEIKKITLV